ncbi:DUF4328 domain-containing protein [Streptomyces sp. BG9H]|uniref:DUF4328 domain-containing protein n=2 Tax=Streptomyces anatolicus TaxID=2675858 RepID=A0ABS6YTA2_9ACTN|nr:DUF4328 domain-containing protein [Streptomyces anatolicus]
MLCTSCQMNTASTPQGLCAACVQAAAAAPPPPADGRIKTGGAPAWLRSPVRLGWAVVALLGLVVAADLYSLWAGTVMLDVMNDLIAGEFGADIERRAERADTLYAYSGGPQLVALVATCVVFLVWFHRVRVNAEVFEPYIHRKKRGWTVWGWFVPVVNFWFPRRIAVDIWDASAARPAGSDPTVPLDPSVERGPHPLVNAWWTLWVASLFADRWAAKSYARAEEADEIRSAVGNMMFSDALHIAAAALAVVFVLRLTRMQDRKARSGPPVPQPVPGPVAAP